MKTLAVYHKQLGDTLLLQPALEKLARQDGEDVGLLTKPGFSDLVSLMPGVRPLTWSKAPAVERLLCYDTGDRSTWMSLASRARTKHLLTFSQFYVRFFHRWIFSRIHLKDQAQMYRGLYFWLSTPGDDDGEFVSPKLNPPPEEWRPEGLPTKPFLMVHATSAWQRKCWPPGSWRVVIEHLQQRTQMPVVLTGGTTEWEQKLCSEIAEGMSGVINLGGKTSLRGLMAVAALAEVVFTVDGFVSHLAAAFKRPCMTLFGPTNVNHWHAPSPLTCAVFPGDDPGACKGRKMADITTQAMLAQTERWLKEINFQA